MFSILFDDGTYLCVWAISLFDAACKARKLGVVVSIMEV